MEKIFFTALLAFSPLYAHEHFPSLPSKIFADYQFPTITDRSPTAQAKAANSFLSLLDDEMRKKASFPLDSKERQIWTNLPPKGNETGARLGDLNELQINAGLHLLATVLSDQGFKNAWSIPLADDELLENGKRQQGYGVEDFYISIFGTPSANDPWAIQFEGHHLTYNITFKGEKMVLSPSFIGTRPHTFKLGDKEHKPIQSFREKANILINSLPGKIQKQAIVSNKKGNLKTGAKKDGVIPKITGVKAADFPQKQKEQLLDLISEYVNCLPQHAAETRIEEIKKELDQTSFAWSGSLEKDSNISYIIQGPTLIIEYGNQGRGKDALDHLHAVYRNPTNEYGKKITQ